MLLAGCAATPTTSTVPIATAQARIEPVPVATSAVGAPSPRPAAQRSSDEHEHLGRPAPEFSQPTVDGRTVISSGRLLGQVFVVAFFATWAEPCKQQLRELESLRNRHGSRGLEVIGVSVDDDVTGVDTFAAMLGATYPIIWDDRHSLATSFRPPTMPTMFLVDRKGTVRSVHAGFNPGKTVAELEAQIEGAL